MDCTINKNISNELYLLSIIESSYQSYRRKIIIYSEGIDCSPYKSYMEENKKD